MLEKIKEWFELDSSPKLNGFGCREIKMIVDGNILEKPFHAEIACTTPSSLEIVNTYYAKKPYSKVYKNKKNSKDTLEWVDIRGGKKQRKTRMKTKKTRQNEKTKKKRTEKRS